MAINLTKTDIKFNEFRIWRAEELRGDPPVLTTIWYASVGYEVQTTEGETWKRDVIRELTGALKTKASGLLADIRTYILSQEGL